MRALIFALTGGILWIGLVEGKSWVSFAFGAALGFVLQRVFFRKALEEGVGARTAEGPRRFFRLRGAWSLVRLFLRFAFEVLVANLEQLKLVLAPRIDLRPTWLLYRTSLKSPRLQVLLGLMISLTPGTVTADLAKGELWIHVLHTKDPEAVSERIRSRFESLLLEVDG